jgi:hypothetical protein
VKRSDALRPLSDDHHRALVLARRAKRALAKTWPDVVAFFASDLEPHFQTEERWLFPLLDAAGELGLAERARADHARLRALVRAAAPSAEFATALEEHVRFEERELFPVAERLLALAETVRAACADAALEGYEDASLAGVCHEGAWEAAVSAIRKAPVEALVKKRSSA